MNVIFPVSILVTAAFGLSIFSAFGQATPPIETKTALEAIRKKYDLPALAVVVVKDGKICDSAATGLRKWGEATPVTLDDQFHIGSCTKSMTATLAGMFIDEGKLRWDTTIAEMFPEWKDKMNPQYAGVTVEQLLTHRGGVPTEAPPAAWARAWLQQGTPVEQRTEFVRAVLEQAPASKPGTQYMYSNQGYAIVGAMLEKIAGKPWETLITERLFQPLGMKSAGFGPPGKPGAVDEPWGHTRKGAATSPSQTDNPPAISPAGRVHCTLEDLARYTMLHLDRAHAGGLLKPETLAKLHTAAGGGDYACGWVVAKRGWAGGDALMHNGSNTMWYVVMWLAPEKDFAVVVGTNIGTGGTKSDTACDDVASSMIRKWLP